VRSPARRFFQRARDTRGRTCPPRARTLPRVPVAVGIDLDHENLDAGRDAHVDAGVVAQPSALNASTAVRCMPCVSAASKRVGKTDFAPANSSEQAAPSPAPLPSAYPAREKAKPARLGRRRVQPIFDSSVQAAFGSFSSDVFGAGAHTYAEKSGGFCVLGIPEITMPTNSCGAFGSVPFIIWLLHWGTSVWGDAARTARRMPRLLTPGSRKASALKAAAVPPKPNRKVVCSQRLRAAVRRAAIQIVARRHDTFRVLRVSVIRDRVPAPFAREKPDPLPSLALLR